MDDYDFSGMDPFPSAPRTGNLPANILIPSVEAVHPSTWSPELAAEAGIYGFDSRNVRSRPFNLMRTRLLKLADANGWRTLGVVSATPGVGKSFVASNLAAALSRTPQRQVYLFDFDLRRSTVAQNFRLEPKIGLNDFLAGRIGDLQQVARRPHGETLVIIPSLKDRAPSAELLGSLRLDELLSAIGRLPEGSISICDLPPAFANDDASILAGKLDAYLLVVEDGRTTKKQMREAVAMLAPAICAGTILNRYYAGLIADDYGYGYGKSNKYADYYGS